MKHKLVFLLALIFSMGTQTIAAKNGTIKYGKFIKYEGNVEKIQGEKMPSGRGKLYLYASDNKNPETIITGNFLYIESEGKKKIEDAQVSVKGECRFDFSGSLFYNISADKLHNLMSISLDGTLSSEQLVVEDWHVKDIQIKDLSFELSYEKGWRYWKINSNSESAILTKVKEIPTGLRYFGGTLSQVESATINIVFMPYRIVVNNIKYNLEGNIQSYGLDVHGSFCDNKLECADGSVFFYKDGDWFGKKVLSGATIEREEKSRTIRIDYSNGDMYFGTLKSMNVQDIIRCTDIQSIKFDNGMFSTNNGKTEKWIKGESFSERHKRLSQFLDDEFITDVENGVLTEEEAKERQAIKKLKAVETAVETEVQNEILQEWFGTSNSVTFIAKTLGTKLLEGFDQIGLNTGEIVYDCSLTFNKDYTYTATYHLSPSEEAYMNQTIHFKRNGSRIRHGEFVSEYCDLINRRMGKENGIWSFDGTDIKFGDHRMEVLEDYKKVNWRFIENVPLEMSNKTSTGVSAHKKNISYPKTLVGKTYEGVVHMGEIDVYIKTVVTFTFKNERTLTAHYSFKSQNDEGVKLLLEMLGPGITEDKKDFEYTYSNGVVKIKGSNETCTLKDNNKVLYWYASDEMNGNLYLK